MISRALHAYCEYQEQKGMPIYTMWMLSYQADLALVVEGASKIYNLNSRPIKSIQSL
jgi:hypothetical protein